MEPDVAQAVDLLAWSLEGNPDFRFTYQSNIAMAFVDAWREHHEMTPDLYQIANTAADNFLKSFTSAVRAEAKAA